MRPVIVEKDKIVNKKLSVSTPNIFYLIEYGKICSLILLYRLQPQ